MLGLRYVSCDRCGLVHADLEDPPCCARCDGAEFAPVGADSRGNGLAADGTYFAGSMIDDR